ncbi:MAG: thioesterase family protein [Spirochaetes bacterium]|nr:thioesterase family protein [Spirochaetota bacterium]
MSGAERIADTPPPRGSAIDRHPGVLEHRTNLTVRSYECDSYGHVNNAVYLNYLEVARHEMLAALGMDFAGMRSAGFGLVVARIDIRYRRPAVGGDALTILSRATKRLRVGGIIAQRILKGEELVAEADVTWVSIDARGRAAPMPPEFDVEGLWP